MDSLEGKQPQRFAKLGTAELSALLLGSPFLDGLPADVVASVAQACDLVELADESQIVRREEPNDSLYIVVYGGLRTVSRDAAGNERIVARAYRGDSVGMIGLLHRVTAPVDIFTFRDSLLLRLPRDRFMSLAARYPELMERLAEAIVHRSLSLVRRQPDWVTWSRSKAATHDIALLLPGGDPYFARAAADLACTAFERYRRVGRVTSQSVDEALGEGASSIPISDPRNKELLAFFQRRESGRDLVLYQCDSHLPAWTERCLRQADRLLVILSADRPDHLADIRRVLEPTLQRPHPMPLDVAFIHSEHSEVPRVLEPQASWLADRANVHHLRTGERADYERVARTFVGEGTALVLSGGGARGIAHVGVIKALEDAGVRIDAIAGASMGSIFAAGFARGWNADRMMPKVRELFRRRMALYDPTLPIEALLAGRKMERVMRSYFEDLKIENLWIPFFCVSTNLSQARVEVHDRGLVWPAVVASCSLPGIFPPRRLGPDWLVDGGIMNNLPIDVMAARFEGRIIASDVSLVDSDTPSRRRAGRLRRWIREIRRRRRGGEAGLGLFETLVRSSMVGGRHTLLRSLEQEAASLYLDLPVGRFGTLDWGAFDELYEVGYQFATERLRDWKPTASNGRTQ